MRPREPQIAVVPKNGEQSTPQLRFSDRIAPKDTPRRCGYERSKPWGRFSRRKFTAAKAIPVPTANTFQLVQILWQRHRLNFRPRGNWLEAPSCRAGFPIPLALPPTLCRRRASSAGDCFSRGRKQIRARWQRDARCTPTGFVYQRYAALQQKHAAHRSAECCLSLSRRVFTHWCTVMNSRWSSNARYSLVLLHSTLSSTYSISRGISYTLDLHSYTFRFLTRTRYSGALWDCNTYRGHSTRGCIIVLSWTRRFSPRHDIAERCANIAFGSRK